MITRIYKIIEKGKGILNIAEENLLLIKEPSTGGGGGGSVDSVNGQTGVVALNTSLIPETSNKRYQTDAQQANNNAISPVQEQINAINFNLNSILEKEVIENGLIWMLPLITGVYGSNLTSSQYLRTATAPITFGTNNDAYFGLSIASFSTGIVPGFVSGLRRHDQLRLDIYNNVVTLRDFRVDENITTDCRYYIGFSQNFNYADPANTSTLNQTNCILVAKLNGFNTLHILHNDGAGVCTSIDLGVDFPANDPQYKYRMILKKVNPSLYIVQVVRTKISTGAVLLTLPIELTTNLPTLAAPLLQVVFITNNGSSINMRLGDYGLIFKRAEI